jgi:adenylosuccinate lyase
MTYNRFIFENVSPLDHRYSVSEKAVFDAVSNWLSEDAVIESCLKAEIALISAHLKMRGELDTLAEWHLEEAAYIVTTEDVYDEEETTHHNIRALVNVIKAKIDGDLTQFVHLGATSADILDTALAYRMKGVTGEVVLPALRELELRLCDIAENEAETPQAGRTHGQLAVPVTFGFAIAEYVSRLGKSILRIERLAGQLKGKLTGAVGAYNAISMITADPLKLEKIYLAELGLKPSEHSTQIVEPEYLLRLLLEMNTAFGVIANLADDLRNLQRSEIAEVREGFADTQVGSSTMPQKRNPWNSEHVKSLWKTFMPRVITFYMDQISEHQRDLSNSASQRFIAEYVAGFCMAVSRMNGVVAGLVIDRRRMLQNLCGADGMMAEPAYILLAESGEYDAHEVIRRITLAAEKTGVSFPQALRSEDAVLKRITAKMRELGLARDDEEAFSFFENPSRYRGLATEKARAIASKYRALMDKRQRNENLSALVHEAGSSTSP